MKLLILASHPVQYHAPVFRHIAATLAAQGHGCTVVYLSDFSIQGYRDREFGASFAWDEPLLSGYNARIVNGNQTQQPKGFSGLDAPGFGQILREEKPTRLLVHTLNYRGAIAAVLQARLRGIPCSLRVETNDVAVPRGKLKSIGRSLFYRSLYTLFDSAIAIGSLNRDHLVRHGIPHDRVGLAYYCVPNRFASIPESEKVQQRKTLRQELALGDRTALLFSGKLIPKKNPGLMLAGIACLSAEQQKQLAVIYLGSGELAESLQQQAAALPDLQVHFAGFKNQKELPPYYLAADAIVLPSRQAGETWGLVVNEGLQAGLQAIISEAVGSSVDFQGFPGVQIIPNGEAPAMAAAVAATIGKPRQFDRYRDRLAAFSTEGCAETIASFVLDC